MPHTIFLKNVECRWAAQNRERSFSF